jgi:hypothetical protein
VEPEPNHIRERLSAGEKFNSLLGPHERAVIVAVVRVRVM